MINSPFGGVIIQFVETSDGIKLAVYDLNQKASKTIILVHGWPLNHKMYEYQLPALLKAGYRIIRFDIRGFGYSEEAPDGYRYNQMAEDLYYIVRTLKLKDFVLLGFSMGGAIATRYMALYDGYGVSKLVLLDAAVPSYCQTERNPYGQTVADTEQLIELGYNDRPALNQYFQSIFFAQEQSEPFGWWFGDMPRLASGTGEIKALIALRYEDCFDDLKRVYVPTLIIHGTDDKICPFGMAELMHEHIRKSQLVGIENAGHGAFYEGREAVNEALMGFIG